MSKVLEGLNAVVSGSSRGIGRAIAIALAEAGANVAINYNGSKQAAEEVASICQKEGVKAEVFQANMGDREQVESMIESVTKEFGSIQLGVSNAAFSDREVFYEANMEGFEKTIQISMWGAYYFLRSVTNQMISQKKGGSIVMVSSPHAYRPFPGAMAYNMSKAAIDQMARTAATELIPHRIRVNILYPGWTDTPGERKFFSEEKLANKAKELPWGRLGTPEEVARGVVFFCDPKSDYINGSSLLIDGGMQLPVEEMHRLETPE
ncbi:Short-chain dehydrogenase/reductase SDR [Planctomycetales bacterium 10988]|nr:Short-chain dehydrogenase/reductase SDR [Planctomycetales bacterium 10988]